MSVSRSQPVEPRPEGFHDMVRAWIDAHPSADVMDFDEVQHWYAAQVGRVTAKDVTLKIDAEEVANRAACAWYVSSPAMTARAMNRLADVIREEIERAQARGRVTS